MGVNELIAELVKALAWPVAAVVLALLVRPFLADRLTHIEGFGVSARFRELTKEAELSADQTSAVDHDGDVKVPLSELASVDEDAYTVAERDPTAAIIAAHEKVMGELRQRLVRADIDVPASAGGSQLVRLARDRGIVDDATAEAVQTMTELRNLVAHGRRRVRAIEAVNYLAAADEVLYSLSSRPGRSTTRFEVTKDSSVIGHRLPASRAFTLVTADVAREVGIDQLVGSVGSPNLGRTKSSVKRPDRARAVADDLDLYYNTQLNQDDLLEMVARVSDVSRHSFAVVPDGDR